MPHTAVSVRGQVTIPAELRKRLGIRAGTRLNWIEEKGRLVLIPITAQRIKQIRGFLKPKPGEPSALKNCSKSGRGSGREKISRRNSTMRSSKERMSKQKASCGAIATLSRCSRGDQGRASLARRDRYSRDP